MKLHRQDLYNHELLSRSLNQTESAHLSRLALSSLRDLDTRPKLSKENYSRHKFAHHNERFQEVGEQISLRQQMLRRDLAIYTINAAGKVNSGILICPYSNRRLVLHNHDEVKHQAEVDHVVSLRNAWQTGAQLMNRESRSDLAHNPLELLVVSHDANKSKLDYAANKWLPERLEYRPQFVARQIAIKSLYHLWVTKKGRKTMHDVLERSLKQLEQ